MENNIIHFLQKYYSQEALNTLELLSGGGSARKYYRFTSDHSTYILTESSNTEENETFFNFTKELNQIIPNHTPIVYHINDEKTIYSQSDLGNDTLMTILEKDIHQAKLYYLKTVELLAKAQIEGNKIINYSQTFSYSKLDKTLILRDLFQFKFYFLNTIGIDYNQGKLIKDFDLFASQFDKLDPKGFVFRDFQSRNIMIKDDEPVFIDYQGGLYGPIFYDLVSLIWQAKANLPLCYKREIYEHYLAEVKKLNPNIATIDARVSYEYCVIARLLQVLGAYGLRGLIEKKPHFLQSISFGISNLKAVIDFPILQNYPELKHIIKLLINPEITEKINQKING